jgi:hypothetical protein
MSKKKFEDLTARLTRLEEMARDQEETIVVADVDMDKLKEKTWGTQAAETMDGEAAMAAMRYRKMNFEHFHNFHHAADGVTAIVSALRELVINLDEGKDVSTFVMGGLLNTIDSSVAYMESLVQKIRDEVKRL